MKPIVIAVVSDLHVGSTVGLCAPGVELDDGQSVSISKAQLWLWEKWLQYWREICTLKAKNRAEVWLVCNGDLFDGDHHRTFQIWSQNPADWKKAADKVLEPALSVCKHKFVVRGTEIHTGNSGYLEEEYAQLIGAEPAANENYSDYEWFMLASGVPILFRHHGSLGQLPWTFPNLAMRQAAIEEFKGEYAAGLFVQSHKHKFADTGMNYKIRVIHTPAWQLSSAWLKSKPMLFGDIGSIAIICHNGEYEIKKFIYRPEKQQPWQPR